MILGIDPSYSSCGVAIYDEKLDKLVDYTTLRAPGDCYKSPAACDEASLSIIKQLRGYIYEFTQKSSIDEVIVEVPALQSKSGGYLAILHGMLIYYLKLLNFPITLVPCTACDSFIKNKEHSKSYIVKYCKDHKWVPDKRINNDVCTAVVFTHLLVAIRNGEYKNSSSRL